MTWGEHHSVSERLAAAAELAFRSGDSAEAERLYAAAAKAEAAALSALGSEKQRTIGITAVSAVALWAKARVFSEAERLAHVTLSSGNLPAFAVKQLRELLQMLWTAALNHSGSNLVEREHGPPATHQRQTR